MVVYSFYLSLSSHGSTQVCSSPVMLRCLGRVSESRHGFVFGWRVSRPEQEHSGVEDGCVRAFITRDRIVNTILQSTYTVTAGTKARKIRRLVCRNERLRVQLAQHPGDTLVGLHNSSSRRERDIRAFMGTPDGLLSESSLSFRLQTLTLSMKELRFLYPYDKKTSTGFSC